MHNNSKLRQLPAIGKIIKLPESVRLMDEYGSGVFKFFVKNELDNIRSEIKSGCGYEYSQDRLFEALEVKMAALCDSDMRHIINLTGIMLHTGLGRAPLAGSVRETIYGAGLYTPVQSDAVTGKRSLREDSIEKMLCELTGAEAVTVVNNNAAATMLILNTIACNKKVVISRGQLVEIGGAFRMPDVMKMSSALMSEVGTTNRTHMSDYQDAIDEETAVLMHVHTSNYRLRGFSGSPDIQELVSLARDKNLLTVDDLGSGALRGMGEWGIADEPLVRDSIAAGADLCCFSGDKLLGGPQAGIICGKKECITSIRKNPFARMFRVDKLTLAGLERTLSIWLNNRECEEIPLYIMLSTSKDILKTRAEELSERIKRVYHGSVRVEQSTAYIGSGSLPDSGVGSWAVVVEPQVLEVEKVAELLRVHGIFSRVTNGQVWLDVIAVAEEELQLLYSRIDKAFTGRKI